MKLKKIKFNNHTILNDLEVDFCDSNGEGLNTVVIIGENGTGKTTLLRNILDLFNRSWMSYKLLNQTEMTLNDGIGELNIKLEAEEKKFISADVKNRYKLEELDPKIVYMPAEISFDKLKKVDNTYKFSPRFLNIVDQNITENIPSFIATKINKEIFKNRNKVIGEVIDKVCEEINSIFVSMELDVKLIGLSEDEETKPVFENSFGKKFDINGLSSGEKQLFLRALSLKFLQVNNSIILIDEPEISLHPSWQQKIIDVYENIGENNQIIIATHSPHIVANVKSEQLRIMKKDKKGVFIEENEKINQTYGHTVENILKATMKLENVRNDDVASKLKNVLELLEKDLYGTDEFKNNFEYLREYLGDLDKDIMLINLEISRRKRKKEK